MLGRLLCWLGLHYWTRWFITDFSIRGKERRKFCLRHGCSAERFSPKCEHRWSAWAPQGTAETRTCRKPGCTAKQFRTIHNVDLMVIP